jgi:putative MATE family efflux protein
MPLPIEGSEDSPTSATSLWREIANALKGYRRDYTVEPPKRAILLLAVPMTLELLMQSVFALVDIFWVAHLGSDAIAVVGLVEVLMTLIYAIAAGISVAATAIVARRIGEKNPRRAAHSAGQMITLSLSIAVPLGIVLSYLGPQLLLMMGASASVVALGSGFTQIMLGGNVTVFMIFVSNAIFRGAGDAALAMRTLWLANGLNIALGPCFIFGWGPFPQMGVTGAALATTISRAVGVIYQLWHLAGHNGSIQVRWRDLLPNPALMRAVAPTAGPGVVQVLISTTSWVALFKILAMFGSSALAGYTIAVRLIQLAMLVSLGVANAAATLVGQSLGASKPDRAEAIVRLAVRFNVPLLTGIGVAFIAFSRPLIDLFTSDPNVVEHGTRALWIVSLGLPIYAAATCFIAAFNGAGDTWTPTRLNFFCLWLGQVPLAWILSSVTRLGSSGVAIAVLLSFSLLALLSSTSFRRGLWRTKRV